MRYTKGQEVVCENGHHIGFIAHDIKQDDRPQVDDITENGKTVFENYDRHNFDESMLRCKKCNALFVLHYKGHLLEYVIKK